ncbi:MAG: tRNA (adenosine(37)-N6)-threonylcarbamoyltransferase complex ATPase subunit type 1 TsaE [Halioglobus sp.]
MTGVALELELDDEKAMVALGSRLASVAQPGCVMFLHGGLGMGKTTLSRGFIQSLGHVGAVKSPTYTLVEPYEFSDVTIYHFDLYRLGDAEELEFMGIRDYFTAKTICLVEWPERGRGVLPPADLVINIAKAGSGRVASLRSQTTAGADVVTGLQGMD